MQNLASTPDPTDALAAAFAAAEYLVRSNDDRIVIRIGAETPALDSRLDGRSWALITAHNPDGRRCSDDRNERAQRTLEQCLRELRPAELLEACNRDPAGHWPDEPAWLFTPESISQADRLARRFGQRAIVVGDAGKAAALRIYRDLASAPTGTPHGAIS